MATAPIPETGRYSAVQDICNVLTPLEYLLFRFNEPGTLAEMKLSMQQIVAGQTDGTWESWEQLQPDAVELIQDTIDGFDALVEEALEKKLLVTEAEQLAISRARPEEEPAADEKRPASEPRSPSLEPLAMADATAEDLRERLSAYSDAPAAGLVALSDAIDPWPSLADDGLPDY
jgi:hypothetical protein